MIRVPYLVDLVNCLRSSTILNDHGIPGVKDIKGDNILVFADWDEDKKAKNYGPIVIIHPLDSRSENSRDCGSIMTHEFEIMVQVKNSRATQQHFQQCDDGNGGVFYKGAFMDAAKFEELLRNAMKEANEKIFATGCVPYSEFLLRELRKPIAEDGWVVMSQLYETSYVF